MKGLFTHDLRLQQFCRQVHKMLFAHNILKNKGLKTRNSVNGNGTSDPGPVVAGNGK
jgi:hypothetical protein